MHLPQSPPPLDLDRLEHLGRILDAAAAELGAVRSTLASRAAHLQWHSDAARAFRAVLHDLLGQVDRSGSRLTDLAAAVRAHRARAARRAAVLSRLTLSALGAAERAVRRP